MERRCNLGRRDNCDNCEVVILGAGLLGRSRNMGASLLCWDRIVGYSGKWNKVAVGLYRDRNVGGFGRESKVIVRVVVVNSPCLVILGGKVRGEVVILGASLL